MASSGALSPLQSPEKSSMDVVASVHEESQALYDQLVAGVLMRSDLTSVLADIITYLLKINLEDTARFISSWPSTNVADDFEAIINSKAPECKGKGPPNKSSALKCIRYCIQVLGLLYRVGVSSAQLQRLFDMMHPESSLSIPEVHGACLWAMETAVRCRALRRSGASAFWSFPGWIHASASSRSAAAAEGCGIRELLAKQAAEKLPSPLLNSNVTRNDSFSPGPVPASMALSETSGFLSLSWQQWPFPKGYALWTTFRVRNFGTGTGEDKSSLLRVIAGNGARLHIWLEHHKINILLQEAPSFDGTASPKTPSTPIKGPRASVANELIGGIWASIAKSSTEGPPTQSLLTSAGPISIPCTSVVAGRWVSLHVLHVTRRGYLGAKSSELVLFADACEIFRSSEIGFPVGLAAAPLVLARIGESFQGEVGPMYFWNDECGPLTQHVQGELARFHDGDTIHIIPPLDPALDAENPVPKVHSLFHPASFATNLSFGDMTKRSKLEKSQEKLSCDCPNALGKSASQVIGYNGVCCVAGRSIRDSIQGVGGLRALLPLFGSSLSSALKVRNQATDQSTLTADLGLIGESAETRSCVTQMLDIFALFLRDHLPNCQQALRSSIFSLIRLEIAGQLRMPEPEWHTLSKVAGAPFSSPHEANPTKTPPAFRRQRTYFFESTDSAVLSPGSRTPAYTDTKLVPAIFAVAHAAAMLPALKVEAWKTFACWLPMYSHAASHIQLQLLGELRQAARAKPDFFRFDIGVEYLVEGLHLWYGLACLDATTTNLVTASDMVLGKCAKASGHLTNGYLAFMTPGIRRELLREYLRFLGCCLGAGPAVLQPAETSPSVTNAAMARKTAGRHTNPMSPSFSGVDHTIRKAEMAGVISLLCDDWTHTIPFVVEEACEDSPLEQLQAEVLAFISALLDFDASHVANEAADALTTAALEFGAKASTEIGAKGGVFAAEDAESKVLESASILVAPYTYNTLQALDSGSGGDFFGLLLYRVLLRAQSAQVLAAALRTLFCVLRANFGRPGRWLHSQPWKLARIAYRTSTERDKLVGLLKHLGATAVTSAATSASTTCTYPGSYWSHDFARAHGFEILYYILRDFPEFDSKVYNALLEGVFIPDGVEFTTGLELEIPNVDAGSAGQRSVAVVKGSKQDMWTVEARSVSLRAAVNHNARHAIYGGKVWFKATYEPSFRLQDDAILCNPDALRMLLRLMPHLPLHVLLRALKDLSLIMKSSDLNRRMLLRFVPGWEVLIFLALLGVVPTTYPSRDADGSLITSNCTEIGDQVYAAGEELLVNMCRHSLNHYEGWKPFQRLMSLQPLFVDERTSFSPAISIFGERHIWSTFTAAAGHAMHGRRLITSVFSFVFDDFDARRTKSITKAHIDNLVQITALCDRIFCVHGVSETMRKELGASTTSAPPAEALLVELKDAIPVLPDTEAATEPRRDRAMSLSAAGTFEDDEAEWDRDGAIRGATAVTASDESRFVPKREAHAASAAALTAVASVSDSVGGAASSVTFGEHPEVHTAAEAPLESVFISRLTQMWDRMLSHSVEKGEKFLQLPAPAFPLAGNLRAQLVSVSRWVLATHPVWHEEFVRAVRRLARILPPIFPDVAPKPRGIQLVAAADATPPSTGRSTSRGRSASRTRRQSNATAADDDWEDVYLMGRTGITSEQWVLFVIKVLHDVVSRIVSLFGTANESALRFHAMPPAIPVLLGFLGTIMRSCAHAADVAHLQLARFQHFIDANPQDEVSWDTLSSATPSLQWVQQPMFSRNVSIAIDAIALKEGEMMDQLDDALIRTWTGVEYLFQENAAVLKPVLQEAVAAVQEREQLASSAVTVSNVMTDADEITMVAVAGAAARIGRTALARMRTVRDTIGTRIAAAITVPEQEDGSLDDSFQQESRDIGAAPEASAEETARAGFLLRTDLPNWLSESVKHGIGPVRMFQPQWYTEWWNLMQLRSKDKAQHLLAVFASRHDWNRRKREDLLGCAHRAHLSILRTLSLEAGPWAGDSRFTRSAIKLSMFEDSWRRRMRIVPNHHALDYRNAAYAIYKESMIPLTKRDAALPAVRSSESAMPELPDSNVLSPSLVAVARLLAPHAVNPAFALSSGPEDDDAVLDVADTDAPDQFSAISQGGSVTSEASFASEAEPPPEPETPSSSSNIHVHASQHDAPTTFAMLPNERQELSLQCKHISKERVAFGICKLTNLHIIFEPASPTTGDAPVDTFSSFKPLVPRRWALSLLNRVLPRRFLLQQCALELFFSDGSTCFLAFPTAKLRDVFQKIWDLKPPRLVSQPKTLRPQKILEKIKATERWQRREISNFEYLMEINTIAGRSFNDLTQYPVFPWVISDYSSPSLDLSDPATFRDLSKPIGAINEARLDQFRARMEGMEGGDIPPFMYGSHYSNAGFVIFYLLRLEPFTRMHVELQSGHFDCPDRLFFSVPECWKGVTRSMTDVKELVPEWYTTPEMFQNGMKLPLGELQDQAGVVSDVILPPWAASAHEFVWVNRAALESEYVSSHLHEWIDLVFGYKQRGPAAQESDNLFYYLTYEGAVNLDDIEDELLRQATESQIVNFGQTPTQLFTRPHPPRLPVDSVAVPLFAFDTLLSNSRCVSTGRARDAPSRKRLADSSAGIGVPAADAVSLHTTAIPDALPPKPASISAVNFTECGVALYTAALHPSHAAQIAAHQANARVLAVQAGTAKSGDLVLMAARPAILNGRACTTSSSQALIHVFAWSGKIVGVYGDYSVAQHKWTAQQSYEGLPFECRMDKPRQLTRADLAVTLQVTSDTAVAVTLADVLTSSVRSSAVIAVPSLMRTTPMIVSPSSLFAVVIPCHVDSARSNAPYPDAFAFSCGYADGGMRWQSVAHKTKSDCWIPSASKMVDVCTLTVAEDRCTLLTGHCDGSAHLWIVSHNSTIDWVNVVESASSSFDPHALGHLQATVSTAAVPMLRGESSDIMAIHVGTLYAQKSPITCVAANRLLCIAVTCALDGKIVISSLSTAKPLRVIYVADVTAAIPEGALPHGCSLFPQHAVITSAGYVCVAFLAHSPVAVNSTVLALIHLNGSIVSAIHIAGSRKGSLAKYTWLQLCPHRVTGLPL
jgi:hypothetical protein